MPPLQASVVLLDSNIVDSELVPPTSLLANITRIAWAPDTSGRLFIALKTGQVMIAVNGAVPVSYTHLDVYKRQWPSN